jgi:peptide deformylase
MAILPVVTYGNKVLRQPAEPVHKVSAKIQKLVADMFDTMYNEDGCGLAAPQVGVSKQLFILDCSTDTQEMPKMVFINPRIVRKKGALVSYEGCLSFPGVFVEVKRYKEITVRFMDEKGRNQELTVDDGSLLCRAIQHEMDHLTGILFTDHVIDEATMNKKLTENKLPLIDGTCRIQEPELDAALALKSLT